MMPASPGWGLRGRLTAFFVVITVVPLSLAVGALQLQLEQQSRGRTEAELVMARNAAATVVQAQRRRAGDLADDLVDDLADALSSGELPPTVAEGGDGLQPWLESAAGQAVPERADFAALVRPDGRVLALLTRQPRFADRDRPDPDLAVVVREGSVPGALTEVRQVQVAADPAPQQPVVAVVAGQWADEVLLERTGVVGASALVADGEVLATTGPEPSAGVASDLGDAGQDPVSVEVAGRDALAVSVALEPGTHLVVWSVVEGWPRGLGVALLILVPAVAAAAVLGWLLAASVAAPIRRAADVARAVADGDLSRQLEPGGGPELSDLAVALNTMSSELAARVDELERSRDELRASLSRLGQTLSSSLDLNRTLAVVVETAKETLDADGALLMLLTPGRDVLYAKVGRGVEPPVARLALGEGVAGHVAKTGSAVLLPAGDGPAPQPAAGEPPAGSRLAVPLLGRGRTLGVLVLLRGDSARPFTSRDLETIRSFAVQASVAVENVMLHQEAQRLSVTDGLTGLWNFRYFQLQAEREVESASRFERELALAIVDIDHFKDVNDRYGHQVGDAVLVEIARRIRAATRVPDVVARYGGEEFAILLPDTDLRGGMATAERIRAAVAAAPVALADPGAPDARPDTGGAGHDGDTPGAGLAVTCSAGVAVFPTHGRTVASLLRSADAAMYEAKRRGRNRVNGAAGGGE